MRRLLYRFLVGGSLLFSVGGGLTPYLSVSATRPHYGGTLRVEMRGRVSSIDPAPQPGDVVAESSATERIRALVFERLVRLDARRQPRPGLALSWHHDARNLKWQFKLRPNVKWHDGSPLTPADVAKALDELVPGRPPVVAEDNIEIETSEAWPDLPIALATDPRFVIAKKPGGSPGELPLGAGPFRVTAWKAGQRVTLQANEDYWGGRPYLDTIQIEMGRSSRERLIDLELDKADLVELDPAEARRAQQEGRRLWTSAPVDLLSLDFDLRRPKVQDQRLREAVALSIDRVAIQKVLLQNYGEVTGAIFPQWLSGYAFLFSPSPNAERARQLRTAIGAPPPLRLGYDQNDLLARPIAERVAVNAREAGVTLQVSPLPPGWGRMMDRGVDVMVVRTHLQEPMLSKLTMPVGAGQGFSSAGKKASLEEMYTAERHLLNNFAVVPLAHISELVGVGTRIKDWSPLRWGEWRLEDVWLDQN